jgi:DNA-directed RNA polymerase subunit RPC12/RpoP
VSIRRIHIVVLRCKCGRCEHEWDVPQAEGEPGRCASCKSRYWNKPRVRNLKAAAA